MAPAQVSTLNQIKTPTLDELRTTFKNPPKEYSTGPLWTWNDLLTEEQIRSTLQDLAGQNVKQVWVHPRPGLMTPYLSDDWFHLWKITLDEAEKLDMLVWIYDENSYPSGFAGGFVPEALPDSRGAGLRFEEVDFFDQQDRNIRYVFERTGGQTYKNITHLFRGIKLSSREGEQTYLIARVQQTPVGGWFGGKWYVDLLKKGVTEKFIEITFDAYKERLGEHFGKRIPGIFTDEPHPPGSYVGTWVSWNEEIPVLFEEKFGYSLIDHLPSLHKPVGDWKKVRHNYHALILELFVERWAKPNFEWCEAHGLEWTGHYWEHGWPGTSHGPDNMAMYIWHQRPAIDLLMNTYNDTSPNAQFGNVRAVKELASIANQMGRSRTLSENYGAGGWDLRFEDMKRLGDWSYALGVNTNNEHLSYVTLRGARKRDHPQSFSYHVPWFEGYHTLADYFTRLSYVLSQGRQINRIVVIEPTTTAWMYQGEPKLNEIAQSFTDFVNALEWAQVEYDLASEDTIARFGKVVNQTFLINHGEYDLVILPPNMENLNSRTAELLTKYAQNSGWLLVAGEFPTRLDGAEPGDVEAQWLQQIRTPSYGVDMLTESGNFNPEWIAKLTNLPNVKQCKPDEVVESIYKDWWFGGSDSPLYVERGSEGKLFHHRRTLPGCTIIFLCNANQNETAKGSMLFGNNIMLEEWDLMTGTMTPIILPFMLQKIEHDPNVFHSFSTTPHYRFEIPPSGSKLLVLWQTSETLANRPAEVKTETRSLPGSDTTVKRLEPNVLTLDFVDVKVGAEERKDVYTWQANRWIYQHHGFASGNPWDNQVQFRDELITHPFAADSGFEATYRFVIEEDEVVNRPPGGWSAIADWRAGDVSGSSSAEYRTSRPAVDCLPSNLAIVIERPDLYKIYHNDIEVQATPGDWYLDRSFGKIDLSQTAKIGENTVRIVASPMTIEHELEPAYLLGDFSLHSAEKGFVVIPPQPLELKTPWNEQGMPFYADKVEYSRNYNIGNVDGNAGGNVDGQGVEGKYFVKLPDSPTGWYGTTARVLVNGTSAGFVVSAPWQIEITPFVKSGENTISVQVYGTPKNLLGPHHAGPLRGSAWPHAFQRAPEKQPAGSAYDVIGCGLFKAFEVISVVP